MIDPMSLYDGLVQMQLFGTHFQNKHPSCNETAKDRAQPVDNEMFGQIIALTVQDQCGCEDRIEEASRSVQCW